MKRIGWLLVFAAAAFARSGEAGETDGTGEPGEPAETREKLRKGAPRYKVRFNFAVPEGRTALEKPPAMKGKVDSRAIYFFDLDGNGKFNEVGVDGWALSDMRYMMPFEPRVVIGLGVYSWRLAADGSELFWSREEIPVEGAHRRTLIQFNTWRWLNGLPAVTVDPVLSDGCQKHCDYMEKHGFEHTEQPGEEGYTAEGAAAGRRSCLGQDGPGMSVLMFYASFYHRLPLLHPGTRAIGIGNSRRYTAVDGLTRREARAWQYPIVVPAPNSWLQPTHFSRESPNPVPDGITAGFPITLTFDRGAITDAVAELRVKSAKGKPVSVIVSAPDNPANRKRARNRRSICLIPTRPLRAKTIHWVKVGWRQDGEAREKEWVFKTGSARPVIRYR